MCALKSSQYLFKTFQGSSNNCSAKLFCGSWAAPSQTAHPGDSWGRDKKGFQEPGVHPLIDLHIHVGHIFVLFCEEGKLKNDLVLLIFLLYSSQKEQKQPNAHRGTTFNRSCSVAIHF